MNGNMAFDYRNLWSMLEARNLSKDDFGRLAGLSAATVTKLSENQPVPMHVLERICGVLHCTPNDILTDCPDGPATGHWCTIRKNKLYIVRILAGRLGDSRMKYIYGWAVPFSMEQQGMSRWTLWRSEVTDQNDPYRFYGLNGQLAGQDLLTFLAMAEAGCTLGETMDKLGIACGQGKRCGPKDIAAIQTLHLCNGAGAHRPPFLLEAHGSAWNRECETNRPMSSFMDGVMRCESLYGAEKRTLYEDGGSVSVEIARALYAFIKGQLPVKHVGEMARLNNFEILSPLREGTPGSDCDQGVSLQIIEDEAAKKQLKHIPRAIRLTMLKDAFNGTYAVRICLRNTNNATLDSTDVVSCQGSDVVLEKQLTESVSVAELWIWDLKNANGNGNLVYHSEKRIMRQVTLNIAMISKRLRVEDAWSRRTSVTNRSPDDTIEYANNYVSTMGNLDNEAWNAEERAIASDFAAFIPEASRCEDQGLYLTQGDDQHIRLFQWLKSRLSSVGASKVVVFDPYISLSAVDELFHAIKDNGVSYEIYADMKAEEKLDSIIRNREKLAALAPASFKVTAVERDSLHDRFIMLAGHDRIPTVYMLSNSLDKACLNHSMVVTRLEPALAQRLFEDYATKVRSWEANNQTEVLFDSKNAAARPPQPEAAEEEALPPEEATPERFIALLRGAPGRALTLMAHMSYRDDIERCRRCVADADRQEMTDLLSGVIQRYVDEGCPTEEPPNEYRILVYHQLLKANDPDLMPLYEIAFRFQTQACELYYCHGRWDEHFAARLLWDVNPAKLIETEMALLHRSEPSSQSALKRLAHVVHTLGVIGYASFEGVTDPQREALLRSESAFLRALGVCLPAQPIGREIKPDAAREIEALRDILPPVDWLTASLWRIVEGQIDVCRKKDAASQARVDATVQALIHCAGSNRLKLDDENVVGLRALQIACSHLILRNTGDYCHIVTGLAEAGCLTRANAAELLLEPLEKPFTDVIEKDNVPFRARNIRDACVLLSALRQMSPEHLKRFHVWMGKTERILTDRLRHVFLKTLDYTQWKNSIDALCCLVYLELHMASEYGEHPSPAVKEFEKIAENYEETLKEYSEVYRLLMAEYRLGS